MNLNEGLEMREYDAEEEGCKGGAGAGAGAGGGRWLRLARRRLPVLVWARRYSRGAALADAVAGVTLGCTLVPQGIAYAALADLPVQYGLYSSFVGTLLYVVLGTVKEVSIGPTSLMALLTLQTCHGLPVQYVVLLTFLSGCIVFAMGLLRLGFLVELISPAVTSGFTSATAVIIAVAQIKGLLGISFVAESLVENISLLAANIHKTRRGDAALAAGCCALLLALRKLKDVRVSPKRARLRRALWLLSIGRNALVVLGAAVLAYCTAPPHSAHPDPALDPHPLFKLSGRVAGGLPAVALPAFSAREGNATVPFAEMARRLSPGVLLLPLVMALSNTAIAKAFTAGGRVDATQEMLTLGLCNVLGALVGSMPVCGAFTRSAVSHASGVRTPLAGLYSGVITLTALSLLTQYFYFIPRAALSSVLVCAVIFMVDYTTVARLWRESRPELCVLLLTFVVSVLAAVELALLCGALAALARLLRHVMRPSLRVVAVKTALGPAVVARPALALLYANAEHVCARLERAARAHRPPLPLLIDCARLSLVDHTARQVIDRLIKKLSAQGQRVVLFNAPADVLRKLETIPSVDAAGLRCRSAGAALAGAGAGVGAALSAPALTDPAAAALLSKEEETDANV